MALFPRVSRPLLTGIVLVLVSTAAVLVLLYLAFGMQLQDDIVGQYLLRVTNQAVQEYHKLAEPVEQVLSIERDWAETGVLDPSKPQQAAANLIPLLRKMQNISGMIIANDRGEEFFLLRKDGAWWSRSRPAGDEVSVLLWRRWSDDARELETREERLRYDPRLLPWFHNARKHAGDGQTYWTDPFVFESTRIPGQVAATAIPVRNGLVVLALEVPMYAVYRAISSINVEAGGLPFLFHRDGKVFAPGVNTGSTDSLFVPAGKYSDLRVRSAVRGWVEQKVGDDPLVNFTVADTTYWAGYAALDMEDNNLLMGVIVPQHTFFGQIRRRQAIYFGISLVVILLGAGGSVAVVRRYGRKSLFQPVAGNFEQTVRELIRAGESKALEFKSTMRMNLAAGQAGKEIEIAWLKAIGGFMNTDGGIILIGVDDEGNIVGTEADGFENDDKCRLHFRNLVKTHIGLEFSQDIRFTLGYIEEKRVCMVECQPSAKPVFLKHKGEESFYIRSGPSSVRLVASDMLKYLENRS